MEVKKNAAGKYEALEIELSSQSGVDGVVYLDLTAATEATLVVRAQDLVESNEKRFDCEIVEASAVASGSILRLRYEPEVGDFPKTGLFRAYVLVVVPDGQRQSKSFPINVVGRF